MAETPASLRWQATTLERRAGEGHDLADLLDRHHEDLRDRLRGVLERHTPDVWHSDAASRSRRGLQIGGIGYLSRARDDLSSVVAALRRHTADLEADVQTLRRRANALEAELAIDLDPTATVAVPPVVHTGPSPRYS